MKPSDLDYHLPPELIAQQPIEPRDAARLLVLERSSGWMLHRRFRDLVELLLPGDLLIANRTRVIRARLLGRKLPTGGKAEALLLKKEGECSWEALLRGRKIGPGTVLAFGEKEITQARVLDRMETGSWLVEFEEPIEGKLPFLGQVPLPPYIGEKLANPERYQTIYAQEEGSVAAPTAGLHFTPELMEKLKLQGVEFAFLTLHIGWDTFRPIREEELSQHRMHSEYCQIPRETVLAVNRALAEGRRVIAVGTTSVRALETAAQGSAASGEIVPFSGWTSLFIQPGYQFQVVKALITNFHLPHSTLLALVYAFAGKELIDAAYQEAIRERYRFYSFGDAMLIT